MSSLGHDIDAPKGGGGEDKLNCSIAAPAHAR